MESWHEISSHLCDVRCYRSPVLFAHKAIKHANNEKAVWYIYMSTTMKRAQLHTQKILAK